MVGANHKSVIGTIVERKFRYTLIVKSEGEKVNQMSKKFSIILNNMDPILKKTMTYDKSKKLLTDTKQIVIAFTD